MVKVEPVNSSGLSLRSRARAGEVLDLVSDLDEVLAVRVPDHRRDQPVGDRDRDADVDLGVGLDRLAGPGRVDGGEARERPGARLHHQVVVRELDLLGMQQLLA